ncbi:GTP pyrophosphokinase [Methanosalsum zhilinae]|uniref:GTP pyrophosphokinase n=1 Tax=Methanosalsum zhilinae TaxID=39669 RepID=UPI001C122EF2|nr:GTP pyrophosphokinase [Methanosalsum zhilinae]
MNKAILIACKAHYGQRDKGGEPYILHPLRIMMKMNTDIERICAVLHDVVEDSSITFKELKDEGFSEEVIEVLTHLTKKEGEDYSLFIDRISQNYIACRVKLADIEDNLVLSRIPDPTPEDKLRIEKYKAARSKLS